MYRLLILFVCICYVHLIPLSQFSLVQGWANKNGISSSDLVLVIADGRYIDAIANRNFQKGEIVLKLHCKQFLSIDWLDDEWKAFFLSKTYRVKTFPIAFALLVAAKESNSIWKAILDSIPNAEDLHFPNLWQEDDFTELQGHFLEEVARYDRLEIFKDTAAIGGRIIEEGMFSHKKNPDISKLVPIAQVLQGKIFTRNAGDKNITYLVPLLESFPRRVDGNIEYRFEDEYMEIIACKNIQVKEKFVFRIPRLSPIEYIKLFGSFSPSEVEPTTYIKMPSFNASDPLLVEKNRKFLKEHKLFSEKLQMKVPKEIMEITTSNHSKRVLDYARVYVVESPHLLAIASNDTTSLCKVELDALTLVMNTLIDIRDSMQSNYLADAEILLENPDMSPRRRMIIEFRQEHKKVVLQYLKMIEDLYGLTFQVCNDSNAVFQHQFLVVTIMMMLLIFCFKAAVGPAPQPRPSSKASANPTRISDKKNN